jgi:hypothetical protein
MAIYRFQFKGVSDQDLVERIGAGVAVSVALTVPPVLVDVTVNPMVPGSIEESRLLGAMQDAGWVFVMIV